MNLKDSYIHGGTTSSKGVVKDISLTDGSLVITYADTTSANKSISLGDYVLKSGSTMTGDLILYNGGNGAATPALVFRRGTLLGTDGIDTNYYDWRIIDSNIGSLLIQANSVSVGSWNSIAEFNANGLIVTGKIIKSGGTNQQVLLANGDVKSLSDFMLSNDNNITTILAQLKEEIRCYDDIYEYLNNQAIDTVVLGATNAYIDTLTVADSTTSGSFVKSGGTNQLVLLADGTVKALSDFKIGTYVPLAGTSTSAPITGILYSTRGIYIFPGNNDIDIWHVDGDVPLGNTCGFDLKYLGSGSGNNNDLVLNSHNQYSTHVEVYRVHQEGRMIFGLNPKVKISGTEYEVWNKQNLTNLNQLTNGPGYTTNTGTVTLVSTGVGLTGGNITTTGTIKANLLSETALTNDSVAATETSGRVYPVAIDKSGYLAVNVPWTNINGNYVTLDGALTISGDKTFTGSIILGTNHWVYGINEDGGSMLHFDGTRTVVGSKGASSTAATLIRSSTGHAKVGDGTNEYDVLDSSYKTTTISSSSTNSQIPTALAVYNAINNGFATNDALVYAGTVNGSATSPGTLFPTSALAAGSKGKVWKVAQSGYINGIAVEIGDMIICNSDSAIAVPTSSNYSTINANFDYIQTNLDPTQFVSLVGIQNISGEKTFDVLNVGHLTVTGLAQFTNTINGSINGNAATANLFLNARTLKVNLATTSAQSFNGSANAESIGVSGILPVANGGTGNNAGTIAYTKITGSSTTADMALVSTTTANTLAFKQLGSHAFDSTAYLPLTGGTLTNTGDDILTINRTGGTPNPWIRFQSNGTIVGYIGVSNTKVLKFYDTSDRIVAHSGNSTQSAVTLDWGTNSNALKIAGAQFNVVLPSNPNVTSHLYVGAQDGTANATSALSDPYLLLVEGSTLDSQIQVKAGTGISVSAVNGIITITNSQPDLNHNTDRYVNAATFGNITDDTGILMTLTRAGSDNNTVTAKISAIASTTGRGLAPKLALNSTTNTIATQSSEYVLTYKSGTETTPVWRKLPTNAFKGTASWTSNSADANYPIGFCTTASPTSGNQYDDYYNSIFTFNPSAKALKIDGCTLQYDSTNKCLKFIFTT